MATVQLSQRPLLVLAGAVVLHVILISAQVSTTAGIPFIQVVTFGVFAEVQRGTMTSVDSVRGVWTGYVALARRARGKRDAQARVADAASAPAGRTRPSAARREPSPAARAAPARRRRDGRRRDHRGPGALEFRDMTIDKGSVDGWRATWRSSRRPASSAA